MQNWILYIFCFEILCFSGGQRFYVENNMPILIVWLLTCSGIYFMKEFEYDWENWLKGSCFVLLLIPAILQHLCA